MADIQQESHRTKRCRWPPVILLAIMILLAGCAEDRIQQQLQESEQSVVRWKLLSVAAAILGIVVGIVMGTGTGTGTGGRAGGDRNKPP